ncbi:MAG TPA: VWA domain-containing protein, partial [Verrucomicrobiota bacterium]|nr:VWA domain-containing protein [Verrucomicrobiota bacterium]
MKFQITEPLWLWLLLPSIAWVGWLAWTSSVTLSPVRRMVSLALRIAVVFALVFALAELRRLKRVEGMNVLFLLDVSDSVSSRQQAAAREQVREFVREKPPADRAGLIVFGAESGLEANASPSFEVAKNGAVVPTERTDLAGALRLAVAALPEYGQRRLVLFSDGNENVGDALGAAISARTLGAAVDVVPLGQERGADVAVERFQLPPRVNQNVTFEAKVLVQASEPGPATVQLYRNDQLLGQQVVQLDAGRNLLAFPQSISEPGFYTFDVRVNSTGDVVPQNNRAAGFVIVRGVPRVLLVSQDPAADAPLMGALRSGEFDLRVIEPSRLPDSLAELQSYDAIIASNVAATDLTRDQQLRLQSAVRDFGVGFVCLGGD